MKKMDKGDIPYLITCIGGFSASFGLLGFIGFYGAYEKGAFAQVQEMYVTDANWKIEVPIGVMKTEHKIERRNAAQGEPGNGAYNIELIGRYKAMRTYEYDIDVFHQTRKLTFNGKDNPPSAISRSQIDLKPGEVIGNPKIHYFISGEIDDNDVTLSINPKDYNGTIVGHIYDVKVTPKSNEIVYIKSKS